MLLITWEERKKRSSECFTFIKYSSHTTIDAGTVEISRQSIYLIEENNCSIKNEIKIVLQLSTNPLNKYLYQIVLWISFLHFNPICSRQKNDNEKKIHLISIELNRYKVWMLFAEPKSWLCTEVTQSNHLKINMIPTAERLISTKVQFILLKWVFYFLVTITTMSPIFNFFENFRIFFHCQMMGKSKYLKMFRFIAKVIRD